MERKKNTRSFAGFTLVELIVTITILAILGTIAFLQLGGYTSNARNGDRSSSLANLSKSLDIVKIKTGYYPTPSSLTGITYSGGTVFLQGTIGDSVINGLSAVGAKMSKKPADPKYPNVEYTYSLLENNKEFQLAGAMEEDGRMGFDFVSPAYGATTVDNNLSAYIQGNYNGVMTRVKTSGNNYCILALPSIVLKDTSSSSGTVLNSGDSLQQTNLVFHKKGNLPGSYTLGSVTTANEKAFSYTPLKNAANTTVGSGITAYCNSNLPSDASSVSSLMSNVVDLYKSSGIQNESTSAPQIVELVNTTGTKLSDLGSNIVVNSLGGTITNTSSTPSCSNGYAWNGIACVAISSHNYVYTGTPQIFTMPYNGNLTISAWGGGGGTLSGHGGGGKGGSGSMTTWSSSGEVYKIYVGQSGNWTSGGAAATYVLKNNTVILVIGGGGGAGNGGSYGDGGGGGAPGSAGGVAGGDGGGAGGAAGGAGVGGGGNVGGGGGGYTTAGSNGSSGYGGSAFSVSGGSGGCSTWGGGCGHGFDGGWGGAGGGGMGDNGYGIGGGGGGGWNGGAGGGYYTGGGGGSSYLAPGYVWGNAPTGGGGAGNPGQNGLVILTY